MSCLSVCRLCGYISRLPSARSASARFKPVSASSEKCLRFHPSRGGSNQSGSRARGESGSTPTPLKRRTPPLCLVARSWARGRDSLSTPRLPLRKTPRAPRRTPAMQAQCLVANLNDADAPRDQRCREGRWRPVPEPRRPRSPCSRRSRRRVRRSCDQRR